MTRRNTVLLLAVVVSSVILTGCTWSRTITNHDVRSLDPTKIVIGESTWRDVLREFGPPAAATVDRLSSVRPTLDYFRYTSEDIKDFDLTIAYVLYLPFRWTDERSAWELMVEFDSNGVVSDMYASADGTVWAPFQRDRSRKPDETSRYGEEAAL